MICGGLAGMQVSMQASKRQPSDYNTKNESVKEKYKISKHIEEHDKPGGIF